MAPNPALPPIRRLPRTILALGVVSFFTDISSEMIVSVLPAFLVTLGAGAQVLGLVDGIADTTSALLKLVSGALADRTRRKKPLVLLGYGISSLARPCMALARTAFHVGAVRFLDRVGKGLRTSPRDALVAEVAAPGERGRAFGLQRGMDHLGALIGPLVAFLLLRGGMEMRPLFAWAALPGLLAFLTLLFFVREAPPTSIAALPRRALSIRPPRAPAFRRFLAASFVFSLAGSTDTFLLLRAHDCGVPLAHLPLLTAALHVVKLTLTPLLGGWSDRIGRRRAIALGWGLYAAVYFAFGAVDSVGQIWALFPIYGLFFALTEGPERALVAELAPADERGRAFGSYHFASALAAFPASFGFGWLWQHQGATTAFNSWAVIALAGLLLLVAGSGRRAERKSSPGVT